MLKSSPVPENDWMRTPSARRAERSKGNVGLGVGTDGSGNGEWDSNSVIANVPELYHIGNVETVENLYQERFRGEVVAFDETHRALVLRCQRADRKTTDVHIVNLRCVTNVNIESDAVMSVPSPPAQINIEKVRARLKRSNDERRKMAAAIAKGVSSTGISLFLAIRKTIEDVSWQDRDILVMNSVRIQPPYQPDNCSPSGGVAGLEHQSVAHVRNIVEKHMKDLKRIENSQPFEFGVEDYIEA